MLDLARTHDFARRLVNSGRLSVPTKHAASPLSTPDDGDFAAGVAPGSPALDAPLGASEKTGGWLLDTLKGGFTLLAFGELDANAAARIARLPVPVRSCVVPPDAALAYSRYDARPGTVYLFRPDQLVCHRARAFDPDRIAAAIRRATASEETR